MTVAAESANTYLAAFEEFERTRPTRDPAYLSPIRKAGITRFAELGFPTTRHEEWRFTNLAPLLRERFTPAEVAGPEPTPAALRAFLREATPGPRLVFVNGCFRPRLSSNSTAGVYATNLLAALTEHPEAVEPHLNRYADMRDEAFSALNTAFLADGAYVSVAPGAAPDVPIHLVYVNRPNQRPTVAYPRALIVAGENAHCALIESFVGFGGVYFTNALTELVVGDNAVVDHYRVQREAERAYHVGALYVHQGRSTNVRSHCISLGGSLVRYNINTVLAGEGGDCHLNGLYLACGDQHVDNHLRVDHAAPHCNSREVYRGILDGAARAVFTGRIVVHAGAQKTDAKQTNHNLLLSGSAQVDTKPQLEIRADDVKCTHGATIGQLDDEALFYLRARGIPEELARGVLTYAFAAESLDQIRIAPLRAQIQALVRARLPRAELLEESS
jgi:Fe-S cluster assembly protein SufD